MRKWALLAASLLLAMLLMPALLAQAAPPVAVTITVDEPLPVADGAVLEGSTVCAFGSTATETVKVVETKNFTKL